MENSYSPQHVANYFLRRAEEDCRALTPIKLLKLVYIGYGWMLALTGRKLFTEKIEAWQHGPVIPSLYHEFKHFRAAPITEKATTIDFDTETFVEIEQVLPSDDQEANLVLDKVWMSYKNFSGWTLVEKTHQTGSPWSQVYDEAERHKEIPDGLILDHFKERISKYLDAANA